MSEKTPKQSLIEALQKTDEQLLSNWTTFASLIKNFENIEWKEASKIARQLINEGNALDYLSEVRKEFSKAEKNNKRKKAVVKRKSEKGTNPKKEPKVIPLNSKRDRYSLNFKRLLQVAPNLQEQVTNSPFASGKSRVSGYMDFNLEVIYKDRTGYYLALSHNYKQNGDLVPDPDMRILVDFKNQTVEALSFQNSLYYTEVYDDIYDRKMVRPNEKRSQNAFLEQWLLNLIEQGHQIEWDEDLEEDLPDDQAKSVPANKEKPSIDSFPKELVEQIKDKIAEASPQEARTIYENSLKRKENPNSLIQFIAAEFVNLIDSENPLEYPSQQELDDYYNLNFAKYDNSKNELDVEVQKVEAYLYNKPDVSFMDDRVVAELRDFINEIIFDEVMKMYAEHQSGKLKLRAVVRYYIIDRLNTSPLGVSLPYPSEDEIQADYDKLTQEQEKLEKLEEQLNQPRTKEKSDENATISEVIDETESKTKSSLSVKTLTYFIEQTEGLSKDEAEKKALKLKKEGKSKRYIAENYKRQATIVKNQILKLNYQKLFRLVPDLLATIQSEVRDIEHAQSGSQITVVATEDLGKYRREFMISDQSGNPETWIVLVEKGKRKATVTNIELSSRDQKKGLDEPFGDWLDERIERKRPAKVEIQESKQSHPIVIEWAEGSDDEEIGLNSLEELHEHLKRYRTVQKPSSGYTKVKVRFKEYGTLRIDLSVTKGDFNPAKMDLEDYLDEIVPSFDWSTLSQETDPKRLQKKADRIPTFEVGKVKLTKEHIRAGLTQKDIDWINKHKQGIVITPKKKMKNNTADYFSDVFIQAMKPGKRVSNTGRIYYETRSNRADLTDKGL